jgi:C4-dicarboxylate-specific signal transduction histidine kinase
MLMKLVRAYARGQSEAAFATLVSRHIKLVYSAALRAAEDRTALRHMTRVATAGQLSAAIAHQLNQPLAAILGNAEVAQKLSIGENTVKTHLNNIFHKLGLRDRVELAAYAIRHGMVTNRYDTRDPR